MKIEKLKVEGMSCGHCASTVRKALNAIGATGEVDMVNKQVTVEYDESKLTLELIKSAIQEQGYDVV